MHTFCVHFLNCEGTAVKREVDAQNQFDAVRVLLEGVDESIYVQDVERVIKICAMEDCDQTPAEGSEFCAACEAEHESERSERSSSRSYARGYREDFHSDG